MQSLTATTFLEMGQGFLGLAILAVLLLAALAILVLLYSAVQLWVTRRSGMATVRRSGRSVPFGPPVRARVPAR